MSPDNFSRLAPFYELSIAANGETRVLSCAAAAVPLALRLDSGAIRRHFEERFTAERMAQDYLALYGRVSSHRSASLRLVGATGRAAREAAD